MRFDVVIGNPPYHLSDGGHGRSAVPIYDKFILQAKALSPKFICMIVPARWYAGGKGLSGFRAEMLSDDRIRTIVDFEDARVVFPDVGVSGGVCYFLWQAGSHGPCEIVNVYSGGSVRDIRHLDEFPTLVRDNRAVSIVRKVMAAQERRMSEQVSSRTPFGLSTTVTPSRCGDLVLYYRGGVGKFPSERVDKGGDMIYRWKTIVPPLSREYAWIIPKSGMRTVLYSIKVLPPGAICTETYLVAGCYDSQAEARNLAQYMSTRFFRFLVAQRACSQHLTRAVYSFAPVLDMSVNWTDDALYSRYGLTQDEIAYIESRIKPMSLREVPNA